MLNDYFQAARVFFVFSLFIELFSQISVYRICKLYNLFFFSHQQSYRLDIKIDIYIYIYIYIYSDHYIYISDHISDHYICRTNYSEDRFSVLYKTRCKKHLAFLQAIAIKLYCSTFYRQRRHFDILCLFGELGGIRGS